MDMMRAALIVTDKEYSAFARILPRLADVQWVGSHIQTGQSSQAGSTDLLIDKADVIFVSGLPEKRFDCIAHALRRGKTVWAAAPLAATEAEYRKLAALAGEAGVVNHAAHISRKSPAFTACLPEVGHSRIIRVELFRPYREEPLPVFMRQTFFPYLDRVLAAADSPVQKIQVKTFSLGGVTDSRLKVSLCFNSGMEAEFCVDRNARFPRERMFFQGKDFSREADFLEPGKVAPARPLQRDMEDFCRSVRQVDLLNVTFAESADVYAVFRQIEKQIRTNG
ncbi:MAG: hypothetical protein K2I83_05590 [Bacteroidales bacterium]|nr:hypothetical protein [Bacteroidales bacterium]